MRNLVYIFISLLIPASAFGAAYVVHEGEPEKLNKAVQETDKMEKSMVVIKDPVFIPKAPKKVVRQRKPVKPIRIKKESVHNFTAVSIDGRRSKPKVKFDLPRLPLRRVDEVLRVPASEKILEGQ